MRYTLTFALGELPTWAHDTVTAALDEFKTVAWTHWGKGMLDVSGPNEAETRLACAAALQRIGKTVDELNVDLF